MENLKINFPNEKYYKELKSKINIFVEKLKQNPKNEIIIKSLDSIDNKNFYLILCLFQNFDKWLYINFENNRIQNNNEIISNLFNIEKLTNEDNKKVKNLFCLFIQWIYFLYSELIKNMYSVSVPNFYIINKINYLLEETNSIIIKLYKSNILKSEYIFGILNFFLCLIENNYDIVIDSDKLYKIKNYLLLKEIFFIFQETSNIIFNKEILNYNEVEETDKKDIEQIFYFLEKIQKSEEINSRRNKIIIINQNLLTNFMYSILKNNNFIKILIREGELKKTGKELSYKNKLINFYSNFIKFNYEKSKILNQFLDSLKNAFINLYNFTENKEKILIDLFIQGFYSKLLKNIFFSEENYSNNSSFPHFNSFLFNGFDSEISLNLQSSKFLEKSSLFFSFNILPINNREIYPLFIIEKVSDKKDESELLFYIYLKKIVLSLNKNDIEEYDLYLYKDNKEIKIDNKTKIKSNYTYYFNISINVNKIYIGLYDGNNEPELLEVNKNKKIFDSNEINFSFGYNKKERFSFSGYIGPIIMIKNPSKDIKLNEFIEIVLELKNYYYYFIFLEQNSSYSFEYNNHFENNILFNKNKKKFEKIHNNFECFLFLIPEIVNNFNEMPDGKNNLPDVGSICPLQKNYKFINLNITLVKYDKGIINFIMDNGLSYICLLYEYIYQFMNNYIEEENRCFFEDNEFLFNFIASIFKKTLFILKYVYSEANLYNFNKNLKQIFMNLFSCVKLISKHYYIMNHIINNFFNIIINYCSYIIGLSNKAKENLNNSDNNINNESKINNDLLSMYLSFFNGWVDFLLTPELYDYDNTNTLRNLFDKMPSYFELNIENESSIILNQHIYFKLLSFTRFLNNYFELYAENSKYNNEINGKSNKEENNQISIEEKKEVLECYLNSVKSFFKNYPSKAENIINLKNLFQYLNNILDDNYNVYLGYYNFIKNLIGNDPDLYFIDEKDHEQIKLLLDYAIKYSKSFKLKSKDEKTENIIKNKKGLFNQLISIIMRIIFTKKRINKNIEISREFKKLIKKIDITPGLIDAITEEIKNIINCTMGANKYIKNFDKKINFDKNEKKGKNYTSEELKYISNYYSEIFDLILYFLEYPINNKNINNIKDLDTYEEKVFCLLEFIQLMINGNIENNIKIDINSMDENNINYNDDNGVLTIDTIYCLIYFVKFYNNFLFERLYPEKYIKNFLEICDLCIKSCLINTSIFVEIGNGSKTILELILDICLKYIANSSKQFYSSISSEDINKINNVRNEIVIKEQNLILDFLKKLFPEINDKNKEIKDRFTIFYINDYLRLISDYNLKENKINMPKDINNYSAYLKEFSNYKIINNFLLNENKINFNFSTYFLIKLGGYKKLLLEMNANIKKNNSPSLVEKLKFNEFLELINKKIEQIFTEHEKLYELNKEFFFKSQKAIKYNNYLEVKKRVDHCLKKGDYTNVEQYIINQIFKTDYDKVFTSINSGMLKRESKSFSFNLFKGHKRSEDETTHENKTERKKGYLSKGGRNVFSSINLIKDLAEQDLKKEENIKTPKSLFKQRVEVSNPLDLDSSFENNSKNLGSQIEDDYELYFEETPSSSESNFNNNDSDIKSNFINLHKESFSPPSSCTSHNIQRLKMKQKTVIGKNFELEDFRINNRREKTVIERAASFDNCSEKINTFISKNDKGKNEIPYINFFDEPDEYYLKNPKKEFMMNIFSLNFVDFFFDSDSFKKLKNYYLQNFEGIQAFTKKLDFPSKIKNFSNGLDPYLFLKPFSSFFTTKIFQISHEYFYDYMVKKNIMPKPLIMYQKVLPIFNLENKYDKTCELIKVDHNYYGHIIGSKNYNFIVFEQKNYEFYDIKNDIINQRQLNDRDLDDLFTLSLISKRPFTKHQQKILSKIKQNSFYRNKKIKEKKIVIILFNEIEEILERRFLLMWQAIEIYLKNGKSYFFNFLSEDNCKFFIDTFKNNNILKDKIHEKDYFKNQKIKTEWEEERISTYEYLLFINKYSSRTFNDANQYPIFPWLITKYSKNKNSVEEYRNLKYPICALDKENQKIALDRFQDDEDNNQKFPAHFGTHYSTSGYIYYYLMREEPFTTLLIKLQGYKQENPNRMFHSFEEVLNVLRSGHDNRELIPDLYYKIEQFINLNCVDFGIKFTKLRVDDFLPVESKISKNRNKNKEIIKYIEYIIDNRKLLDGKMISKSINEWIDNIFGVGQLPPDKKNRKKSLNIFMKATYEQKTNLHKKLKKLQKKYKNGMKVEEIINKISNKIDLIISFGQTPYQLFTDKHPKYGKRLLNSGEEDFEYDLYMQAWNKNINILLDIIPQFFIINFDSGKLFLIDNNRKLEIIDSSLFNQKGNQKYDFIKYGKLQLNDIQFFDKIEKKEDKSLHLSEYYIIKQKYCISAFDEKININLNHKFSKESKNLEKINTSFGNASNSDINEFEKKTSKNYNCNDNDYISYYNLYTYKIKNEYIKLESKKSKKNNNEEEYFRFITCRYIDNTFKIYNLPKNKSNLKKDYLPMSFICEDFVTSCCTIASNKFLIGLKNGKLIQWSIEEIIDDFSSKKQNINSKINIKFNKQIQAHKKAINIIEINHRLGIIITAGNDNYVFIRKIYDLELLIPIKIKSKFIITMVKVSPMNFLYIMCFNKNIKKSCILGYTLNGLYFAKSNYDYYETIDFTKSGNIVTWIHKKELQILYAHNFKKIRINKEKEVTLFNSNKKKLIGASWVKFNYFLRKNELESNVKIITYTIEEKKGAKIYTLDVSKMECFD